MSAQHTPGRLIVRNGYSLYAADGKTPVADTCLTNSVPDNDEANARRLVACWNACEGVPTEMLEKAPLDTVLKETVVQRDELLAALKEAVGLIEMAVPFEGSTVRKARAAIAKVEGGAA